MTGKYKEYLEGYLFSLPYIVGVVVLFVIPAVMSLYFAFCKYPMITSPEFSALYNLKKLLSDEQFKRALVNTIYFSVIFAPCQTLAALIFAIILNRSVRFFKNRTLVFFRAVYYFPAVAPWFVIGNIWIWLLNRDVGFINIFLNAFGIDSIAFLQRDSFLLIPSLAFVGVWKGLGYMMFIFFIGLQDIPNSLYEVANMDGVNWWQKLRYITFPMLSPTTFFVLILATLWAFQSFDQMYIMVYDRIEQANINLVIYLYRQGFYFYKMGYASLIAWVLFILTGTITLLQNKFQYRWVHYA